MPISRNVILDLLPIYLAGEASEDTRVLIEEYVKEDTGLAAMIAEANRTPFTETIQTPINKETEMATLEKTQAEIRRTIIVGAAALTASLLVVTVAPLLVIAGVVYLMFMR